MATASRARLSVSDRREQLLTVGTEVFARRPYDDVWISAVAREAGVSRALLYHYFPGKREFFAAIIGRETERIARLTEPDPALPPLDRLRAAIDAYLDYAVAHDAGYRAMHRGTASVDSTVRGLIDTNLELQTERIMGAIRGVEASPGTLRLAVRSWLSFLITACLEWLEQPACSRQELRELCVNTLVAAIAAAASPR